jgi:hypothetical protein
MRGTKDSRPSDMARATARAVRCDVPLQLTHDLLLRLIEHDRARIRRFASGRHRCAAVGELGGWVRSPGVRPRPEPPPEVKSEGGLRAGRARARRPVHARRQATIASGYDNTERAAYCSFALSRRWIFERNKNQFPPAIRSKALRGQCLRMVKEAKGQRPVGKSQSATCAKFQAVACIAADGVIGSRTARTAARSGAAVVPRPAHSSGEEEGRS